MSFLKQNIFAIVVCYHPDVESFMAYLDAYRDKVDSVVVYCNSNEVAPLFEPSPRNGNLVILGNGTNVGIAKAINEGIRWGWERGYKYVMTMDQDSLWLDIDSYFECIEKYTSVEDALFYPIITDFQGTLLQIKNGLMIQSGSVYKMELFKNIGMMCTDYFIDCVDYEILFRAYRSGYHLIPTNSGRLLHRLGYKKRIRETKYFSECYPPIRYFYITRNGVWLWKQFHNEYWGLGERLIMMMHRIKWILLGEDMKKKKIIAILKGFLCGIFTNPSQESIEHI